MTNPPHSPTQGAVVSEHTTASAIGASILQAGGTAADALIATVFAVGTLCPYHSCIGGGGFAIVHTEGGGWDVVDFRSCAPVSPRASGGASGERGGGRGGRSCRPGEGRHVDEEGGEVGLTVAGGPGRAYP